MSTLRRAAYNTVVLYLGKVVGILISAAALATTTRYLGVGSFGDYSAVLSIAAILVSLTELGLNWLVSRELAQGNYKILNAFTNFKIGVTVICLGVASLVMPLVGYNSQIEQGVWLAILYIFFSSMNNLQIAVLQGTSNLDKTAYTDVASRFVNLLLILAVAHWNLGYFAAVAALNLAGLTTLWFNNYFIRGLNLPAYKLELTGLRTFKKELIEMAFLSAVMFLVYKTDLLILARLQPSLDVGIYGAAYRILDVAMTIPSVLIGALYPVLSNSFGKGKSDEQIQVFSSSFLMILLIGSLTMSLSILSAPLALRILAGPAFAISTQSLWGHPISTTLVLQILSVFLLFSFLSFYANALMVITRKQRVSLWVHAAGLVFNVGANILLIPYYSYVACAVITVVTQMIITIPMLWQLKSDGIAMASGADVLRVLGGSLLALVVSYWVYLQSSAWSIIFFIILWPSVMYLCGGSARLMLQQLVSQARQLLARS